MPKTQENSLIFGKMRSARQGSNHYRFSAGLRTSVESTTIYGRLVHYETVPQRPRKLRDKGIEQQEH